MQGRFEVAKLYRQHVDAVAADRALEEYLQAMSTVARSVLGSVHVHVDPMQCECLFGGSRARPKTR